jgi:NTP pyrophosphatase (non-canonical NTP hydrolase)
MTDLSATTWHFEKSSKYKPEDIEILYLSLALGGEVGELQNLVKKVFRRKYHTKGHSSDELEKELPSELADVLYYLLRLSASTGVDLEKAFKEKMKENKERYNK